MTIKSKRPTILMPTGSLKRAKRNLETMKELLEKYAAEPIVIIRQSEDQQWISGEALEKFQSLEEITHLYKRI